MIYTDPNGFPMNGDSQRIYWFRCSCGEVFADVIYRKGETIERSPCCGSVEFEEHTECPDCDCAPCQCEGDECE